MTFAPDWYFFGCWNSAGHHCHKAGGRQIYCEEIHRFDGVLCPVDTTEQFVACLSRIGNLGLTALAFWDRTVDKRPGSNSIIFAPSLTCDGRTLLLGAAKYFPVPYARWDRGITVRAFVDLPARPAQAVAPGH